MKNKEFFYRQYDKINWINQVDIGLNHGINKHILEFIEEHKLEFPELKVFDLGFGIGYFIKSLREKFINIFYSGCEPSYVNFKNKIIHADLGTLYNVPFQEFNTSDKFNFIVSIYVFPHFLSTEIPFIAEKIMQMLDDGGYFILVVAEQKYIESKLKSYNDLSIEKNTISYNGKNYEEHLHYTEISKIGRLIDFNRDEDFYQDVFESKAFKLVKKENYDDSGFLSAIFIFKK